MPWAGIEAVLAGLLQPALLVDGDGRVMAVNRAFRRSGLEASSVQTGEDALLVFAPAAGAITEALRGATPAPVPMMRFGVLRAIPLGGLGTMLLLEPPVGELVRPPALDRLLGGIAHDFNNLLGVMLGASAALRGLSLPPEAGEELGAIDAAARQAGALIGQLREFGPALGMAPRVVPLNDTLRQFSLLLPRLLGTGISLDLQMQEPSPHIRVDPSQWEQVLLNLVVNAREAMQGQGRLRVRAGRTGGGAAGPDVAVEITDSGPGIALEVIPRLFEPFFTTRTRQGGTGQGLALVHDIVGRFGGAVEVEGGHGTGATFRILLPDHVAVPEDVPAPAVQGPVLLVDDEPGLLRAARFGLQRAGFGVEVAFEAEEALARLAAGFAPCLLATDVTMPGMDGTELARAARDLRPDLPILLLSGYPASAVAPDLLGQGVQFLAKPHTTEALLAAVWRALKQMQKSPLPPVREKNI